MPIGKLLKHPQASTALTGALSGAAGGALVSAFTQKKSAKKLLKGAGLVAVGGLAWQAYQSYRQTRPVAAPTEPDIGAITQQQFNAVVAPEQASSSILVVQSMIAAAHADGHMTDAEQAQIWQHALESGLAADELESLQYLLSTPLPVDHLAAACSDMATKIEVYTAALLVIDGACDAGKHYLSCLAAALALPAPLVATLRQSCAPEAAEGQTPRLTA